MRERLRQALKQIDAGQAFEDIDQDDLPEGDMRRGYPTPTVLVDAHDLYGLVPPTRSEMRCRLYPGGLPTAENIARHLKNEL
ncbi:MAG: hypothetical protein ABSH22_10750 [Tepidisphaeraceae bacterium]|jgi:hypothetical protein